MQSFSASAPGILKHPLIRGADFLIFLSVSSFCDSSPLARGRLDRQANPSGAARFIPSCEGQTCPSRFFLLGIAIHPLLRGADRFRKIDFKKINDSSPLARGRHQLPYRQFPFRFIPSCEGQTIMYHPGMRQPTIHPLLRGADCFLHSLICPIIDSSPLARGRHSVFMRLSAALSTSLCNLHKCPFQLQLVTHHFLYL